MGTYVLVDVMISVENGEAPRLFYTIELTPNE